MTYHIGNTTTPSAVFPHITGSRLHPRTARATRSALRGVSRFGIAGILLAALGAAGAPSLALACTLDAECDNGLFCDGAETCQAGDCLAGVAVDCSTSADQCNDAACTEEQQGCVVTPKIDGFGCDDGDPCSYNDRCQAGACVATMDGDSDNDGYCDAREIGAGCDPANPSEIPPQATVYSGGFTSRGETLLTFNAPSARKVFVATDPTCATAGACSPTTRFCTSGKVGDPCTVDADCNQLPNHCRIVINYGDITDLTLQVAKLGVPHLPPVSVSESFPVSPGCSRKVDIVLPTGFRRARLKLKAHGTIGGRMRRDSDRLVYLGP